MKKFLLIAFAALSFIGLYSYMNSSPVKAAAFDPNNIMGDSVFDDSSTMSAAQIDSWLNANWPNSCISTGNGFSSPLPTGYSPSTGFTYGGNVSAGTVIATAAQAYDINPEVILSTLEKESSVVTGDASYGCTYMNTAMGYDCPDSGACPLYPATESGFSKQVINAAWLLKFSEQRSEGNVNFNIQKPGWDNSDDPLTCYGGIMTAGNRARSTTTTPCPTSTSPPGNQVFYYDGYTTIDGTTVQAETGATAALYDYTPHFSGNQNFVNIFEGTFGFGSTDGSPIGWEDMGQGIYSDSGHTTAINPNALAPNTTYYLQLQALNTGNFTWTNGNNPVLLATSNPGNRASAFCNATWWENCSRAASLQQSSVAPGQTGTFNFSITTPSSYGTWDEYFNLVSEGNTWLQDIGLFWQLSVRGPTYSWQPISQSIAADSGQTMPLDPNVLAPNTTYYMQLKALNTGNTTWTNSGSNPVRLGTTSSNDSAFCNGSWITCTRPAVLTESSVAPGQTGTFNFTITTPSSYGTYQTYFNLLAEGVTWMNDVGQHWQLVPRAPDAQWQYAGQAEYTDATKTTNINLSQLSNGTRFYVVLSAVNTGNTTWTNSGSNPVRLGTSSPNDRTSTFCDPSWISCNRPANLDQSSVAPGQTGTFSFWMQAPDSVNGTQYNEYFQPVVEGTQWMNNLGQYWSITMQSSTTAWQYEGQSSYSDAAMNNSVNLSSASPNTTYYLQLQAKNTSGIVWSNFGSTPLRLGTPNNTASDLCSSSWIGTGCNRPAVLQQSTVSPGQTGTFNFSIQTPSSPVNENLYLIPVIDGQTWLDNIGLYWQVTT